MKRDGDRFTGSAEGRSRDTGLDEDFLYHLRRGTELLAAGKNEEARDELERAAHLRPRNLKAHNLLGLSYFKLGLFERAIEVYERLVQESPRDATLRTNLGLVHLKSGQTGEAVAQLETAVDLVPNRVKALNYLGLAYAQARTFGKAKRVFERSGNIAMVRRMDAAMRGDLATGAADLVAGSELAPQAWDMGKDTMERRTMRTPMEAVDTQPASRDERPAGEQALGLSELVQRVSYEPRTTQPFELDGPALTLQVDGELRARLARLLWIRGELTHESETKRFRGRITDQPFGEGEDRVVKLKGRGVVALCGTGLTFTPVELTDEALYLVESSLLAFESALAYENGRLPGGSFADLALIHLRGSGKAMIRSVGPLRSLMLRASEPIHIPVARLVGWLGNVTPTLSGIEESPSVQLQGEGWVLWTTPVEK